MSSQAGVMIELEDLCRDFGETRAVRHVSFRVRGGEVFGYIGPNGAGKTTSMRILAGLDTPTSGDARVDGFSVVDDPDRARLRLGFMPDHFDVVDATDCRDYLDFFARAYGLRGTQRRRALHRVMRFTGVDAIQYKPVRGLSKGMKQRLCLSRALIHDPPVLVLDEPAAGLDPRARIELREVVRELARQGKAVLISSHILTELAEICDRIGIIEQGELIAEGAVAEMRATLAGRTGATDHAVRILGDAERLADWLRERDQVDSVVMVRDAVNFRFAGPESDSARLLREMVLAGFDVVEYVPRSVNLEDVFLDITRGRVQ